MTLRVLDTGLRPARWNVAMSAALLESVDAGAPATLRFHRYPASCILGRNQDAEIELDLPACRRRGIEIARRVTGGGTVVMGPGVLALDLVTPATMRQAQCLQTKIGGALAETLSELGFDAQRPTPGSIEIAGRKVSGSAGRLGRHALLHQATLIVDLSQAAPLALLRRRTEGGRPTADPRHRVGDLARSSRAPRDGFEAHLARAIAATLRLRPAPSAPTAPELARAADILAREIGRDDYTFAQTRHVGEAA